MTRVNFTRRIYARVSPVTVKLLNETLREHRKESRAISRSDVVRIAIIREARRVLGAKRADAIIVRGVEIGGRT